MVEAGRAPRVASLMKLAGFSGSESSVPGNPRSPRRPPRPGPENARVVAAILTEAIGSGVNVAKNDTGPPIAEGVGQRDCRVYPVDLELEVAEERRGNSEGMDGRADVMGEAGQGQLLGPGPPADDVGLLDDEDPSPASCHLRGGREPVGAGADDHCVVFDHVPMIVPQGRYEMVTIYSFWDEVARNDGGTPFW